MTTNLKDQAANSGKTREQIREDGGRGSEGTNPVMKDFVKVFIMPVIVNKIFMFYFGINYSAHPGEGYGYGLTACVVFLLFTVGRFIWKYRHIQDP